MTFEKGGSGSFAKNIKAELMEFRARITALEAQVKTGNMGGGSGGLATATPVDSVPETGADPNYPDVGIEGSVSSPTAKAAEIGKATDNIHAYTESVVDATYLIREASIAMRGYGMALDQLGLSREQKKLIHEMEEFMMMIHKAIQTIHLLEAANVAFEAGQGPLGLLEIGLAGGVLAGSMAYGNKLIAGAGV